MKRKIYTKLFALLIAFTSFCCFVNAQPYTESFNTAPILLDYPGYPAWKQTAEFTLHGAVYQVENSGNGSWVHTGTGGYGNGANLVYSTAADCNVTIRRKDLSKFTFYGVWLKYVNYTTPPYAAPWLTVTYTGSGLPQQFYNANTTVQLETNVVVSSVTLNLHGLTQLNFDEVILGPAPPTATTAAINQFTNNSALLGGNVTSDDGFAATEKGFVYNTTGTPTTSNTKIISGSGIGAFSHNLTGLGSSTNYFVRAYATSSVGTGYGTQQTFRTADPFMLAQTHFFNSAWASTINQPTPFTKYVEGWDVTATATAGNVSVNRIISLSGTNSVGEGIASLRAISNTAPEDLISMGVKANNGSGFDIQGFKFKYLTKTAGTSFEAISITGYKMGVAVPGAIATLYNISQATSSSFAYTPFDLSGNDNFNNIDQFIITVSGPLSGARLNAIDIDSLLIQNIPAAAPIVTTYAATAVSSSTAILHGAVDDNGAATTTGFEWGISPSLIDATSTTSSTGANITSGQGTTGTTLNLTGLGFGTTYYFRAKAENSAGTTTGAIFSFTTRPEQTVITEPYETFTQGQTSFMSNGLPFILSPLPGFMVDRLPGFGYNSSDKYLSNLLNPAVTTCSFKTTNGSAFTAKSIWIYPSSNSGENPTNNGAITIRGKKSGIVQFTMVIPPSAFTGDLFDPVSRGFSLIDFSEGVDNSNTDIDELEFELAAPLNYFALDHFKFGTERLLPLTITKFSGQLKEGMSQLHWETSAEQNTSHFVVEHSTEASKYTTIGTVKAAGNSATLKSYAFTHQVPATGMNYYRLKMTDMDGSFTYSNVVKIELNKKINSLQVYPNPVTGNIISFLNIDNISSVNYIIYDAGGKAVQQGSIRAGSTSVTIDRPGKGNYFIQFSNGQSAKFLRQ